MNPEILRQLSGDHDLLWLLPAALLPGDVITVGGACWRTVLAPVVVHPAGMTSPAVVAVRVNTSGAPWELAADRHLVALRPVECPQCGRPERHDPVWCTGSPADTPAWQGAECPF